MARLSYECDNSTKGSEDEDGVNRQFPCAPDKYCFYCCCSPQCCFVIQRKPPKHFWEAWYFWLGVAFLLIIVLSTSKNVIKVGTYVVTNCKQNLQAIGYGVRNNRSSTTSSAAGQRQNDAEANRNEISINVIPTSAALPTHRKIMLIAPQPSFTHLTPIVA